MSKLVILVLSCAIACLSVAAEQPSIVQHINAGGNIVIYQPESLGKLVSTPEAVASDVEREESDGYVNASGSSHVSTRVGFRFLMTIILGRPAVRPKPAIVRLSRNFLKCGLM